MLLQVNIFAHIHQVDTEFTTHKVFLAVHYCRWRQSAFRQRVLAAKVYQHTSVPPNAAHVVF